jgi:hypothetical protein
VLQVYLAVALQDLSVRGCMQQHEQGQ